MNKIIQTAMTKNHFQTAVELRSCGVCDFQGETEIEARVCPKCEEPTLLKAETVAWHGAIVSILGMILMFMGFALILITNERFVSAGSIKSKYGLPATQPPPCAEFVVYSILGGLFCLGFSFFIAGAVQAYNQRRNLTLLNWSISLTSFFFLFVNLLMYAFSD